jgi:hypothetical protein
MWYELNKNVFVRSNSRIVVKYSCRDCNEFALAVGLPALDSRSSNRTSIGLGHSVGLAIEVVRQGRVAFARGYGNASLELNVPIRVETVFRVGSITKQFTAAAVLLSVSREDSPSKTDCRNTFRISRARTR